MKSRLDVDLIEIANTKVTIESVLRSLNVHVYEGDTSSKIHCPFEEFTHDDGGLAPAMKIYLDNTCYCFACGRTYPPVLLYAEAHDVSKEDAARTLLEGIGYVPPTADSLWDAIVAEEATIDTDALAEALKIYCSRISPEWETRQFDEEVAATFRACVDLLPRVKNDADAKLWLTTTKRKMHTKLGDDS